MSYVGRLAPSPTGALHLGNVRTFLIAWLRARSQVGRVILRMEDLDHPKDKPGAAAQAIEDLRWLGFDWDAEYVQSERKHLYRAALESLLHPPLQPSTFNFQPRLYPCVCSRRDVEAAQSAPHAGEQLYYPGTCRDRFPSWSAAHAYKSSHSPSLPLSRSPSLPLSRSPSLPLSRSSSLPLSRSPSLPLSQTSPCWRFRVPEGTIVSFDDVFAGRFTQDVSGTLGDFPVARDEFGAGYTLAVVVDDLDMGVTEVVRGDDLLAATPAQVLIARAIAPTRTFAYCHVPLVVGPDGRRLAKRHGDTRVAKYREAGRCPEEIIGFLAASCGWCRFGERRSLRDLLPVFRLESIPHAPFVVEDADGLHGRVA